MPCFSSAARGADAGEHQQLRRVEGAAGENDLARGKHLARLAGLARSDAACGAVEAFAVLVLHTDRALLGIEQHARRQRVQLNLQPFRMPFRDIEHPLARADALMIPGRERRVAKTDGIVRHHPPVVGVELAVETGAPV